MFVTLHINHFIPLPEFVKFFHNHHICTPLYFHGKEGAFSSSVDLEILSHRIGNFPWNIFLRWFFRSASVLKTLLQHWQFTGVACTVFLCLFSLALVANVLSQSFSWHFRLLWWDSKWLLKAFMFLKVLLELESPRDSHCLTFTI